MADSELENRPRLLQCGTRELNLAVPQLMGVLNVTPDSFSDGGSYFSGNKPDIDKVLKRAEAMLDEGAAIIDIGGESTRPGAASVSLQQELERVVTAVEAITARLPAVISVDTSTPEVMVEAHAAGAGMINDVRALARPGAMQAAVNTGLPVCLMHMQGEPDTMQRKPVYGNVVEEIIDYLGMRISSCIESGLPQHKILVDPGFGFGKTLHHNLQLLNNLQAFKELGVPILVGMSRKSMIGQLLGHKTQERLFGSIALATLAVANGADIVRCHDVAATYDAVRIASAVVKEGGLIESKVK